MKKVLIIIALFVFAAGVYTYLKNGRNVMDTNVSLTPTGVQTVANTITSTPVVTKTYTIPENWKKYDSSDLGLTFYYSPDMELSEDTGNESVRLVLLGPSQSRGTEVYDGIILTFRKGTFEEKNLQEYVDIIYNAKKSDNLYTEVTDLVKTEVAGKTGYKFSESALGTFTNIYLPTSKGHEYIEISYLLEDPKDQGFSNILKNILDSLQID